MPRESGSLAGVLSCPRSALPRHIRSRDDGSQALETLLYCPALLHCVRITLWRVSMVTRMYAGLAAVLILVLLIVLQLIGWFQPEYLFVIVPLIVTIAPLWNAE